MPTCIVCLSRFYLQSFSASAEPCDCGARWQHPDRDEPPPDLERLKEARRRWNAGEDLSTLEDEQ